MSLKVYDGFDHYNTITDLQQRQGFLQWSMNQGFTISTPGRLGVGKLLATTTTPAQITASFGARNKTAFVGFSMQQTRGLVTTSPAIFFLDSLTNPPVGTIQVALQFNPMNGAVLAFLGGHTQLIAGALVYTGGTFLGASPNNCFNPYEADYFEVLVTVDGAAGVITVRNNGQTILNLTGVNTQATGNATWDAIEFFQQADGFGNPPAWFVDDLYYCDTTTGPNPTYPCSSFLGDVRVITLFPTGNGATIQWTPLSGANWQNVSETAMDSDTTYNSSSTPGNQDFYNFQALTGSPLPAVIAVQVTGAYRKDDGGSRVVLQKISSSASVGSGTNASIPVTYAYVTDLFMLDPHTSAAWTATAVNGLSAGPDLVS